MEGEAPPIEPLRLGMDNAAERALIPLDNKLPFMEVSADTLERVDPTFIGDAPTAEGRRLSLGMMGCCYVEARPGISLLQHCINCHAPMLGCVPEYRNRGSA